MPQDDIFKRLIVYKALMLVLIIIWGGSVQMSNVDNSDSNNLTDLGGVFFFTFSVVYFIVCYQLYSFKPVGKRLFMPLVLLFIILGFLSEIVNPMAVSKNLFYLFIFYIVSPLFFVVQGTVGAMLYFSDICQRFDSE
ncbi:MAG: hypothetical protein ACON45_08760 [Paracoccaceae bacterium]